MIDLKVITRSVIIVSLAFAYPVFAQNKEGEKKKADKPPGEMDMAAIMEMSKPGPNHKLLARNVGHWTYIMKLWADPEAKGPPSESTGTSVTRELMGGRYFISEHTGKMEMPGPDGKPAPFQFQGTAIDGYDNVKKKFVSTWIDNMSTLITMSEGDYDAATKTFTHRSEFEAMPGSKTKMRQVIKIVDDDNVLIEFFEVRGGKEVRTMEIKSRRATAKPAAK